MSEISSSSFRDPSGFIFMRDGIVYRQVNRVYQEEWDRLISSGLYDALVEEELLTAHTDANVPPERKDIAYKIIQPQAIPFISYPYEWCFSQLKQAALLTLKIQKKAIAFGMSLKDSSAFNVQFDRGKPIFIDTLSFEKYQEGSPWVAYRQFCQHFLAPLALMVYCDTGLNRMLWMYLDGIPLDLASSLLPFSSRFNVNLFIHVHLHAKAQKRLAGKIELSSRRNVATHDHLALIDSLESCIRHLQVRRKKSVWVEYYRDISYSPDAMNHKKEIVSMFLDHICPRKVWDIGANTGLFSRIASYKGSLTVSFDLDPMAVEENFRCVLKHKEENLLPLIMDFTNPSPAIGWNCRERQSLIERGPADVILALAFIHHMAISNNVPLDQIAHLFVQMANYLIIEFVPKEDPQVQEMLAFRKDIFCNYTTQDFEREFERYFFIENSTQLRDSGRIVYLMRRR